MSRQPTDADLTAAARNELTALGEDSGNAAYRLRLVAGALGSVERALRDGADAGQIERAALGELLDGDASLATLREQACRAMREGRLQPENPRVLRALRAVAEAHLRIDNPDLKALPEQ